MMAADQRAIIEFLASPRAYGVDVSTVERIDTHISIVFLAGPRAYKLKRAVRFDYVDYTTLERRRIACEAEVRLNRRSCPALYLGVRPVTREADGTLALDGAGTAVDWVVEMARFDQAGLFDRLAARGALTEPLIRDAADAVARLHAVAERRPDHGGSAGMEWVVAGNLAELESLSSAPFDPAMVAAYRRLVGEALATLGGLLDARRRDGFVRACHGDLHLRNIFLSEGRAALFDAIEFNDEIACCDVMYDLAFLVMDLLHRNLGALANAVLNRYLAMTGDFAGLVPFAFFLSCRAAVRAKTTVRAAATQGDPAPARRLLDEAVGYLAEARDFLTPAPPRLIAVGGLSGSGKSTLAAALAPDLGAPPGAVVPRSDVIRKRLAGLDPSARLGPENYRQAVTRAVYGRIAEVAAAALGAGFTVIADAVYVRAAEREAIAAVAAGAGVPFTGLWLEAPAEVLLARIRGRVGDASDADAAVLRRQRELDPGAIGWRRLDAAGTPGAIVREAMAALAADAR